MATKVIMPQAGQDLETGVVRHWLKAEGDRVAKGEALVEVETEKLTLEVEAPAAGRAAADPRAGRHRGAGLLDDRRHRRARRGPGGAPVSRGAEGRSSEAGDPRGRAAGRPGRAAYDLRSAGCVAAGGRRRGQRSTGRHDSATHHCGCPEEEESNSEAYGQVVHGDRGSRPGRRMLDCGVAHPGAGHARRPARRPATGAIARRRAAAPSAAASAEAWTQSDIFKGFDPMTLDLTGYTPGPNGEHSTHAADVPDPTPECV